MATLNLMLEPPDARQRTIVAMGKIRYQPPASAQSELLEVEGWMVIQDGQQPISVNNSLDNERRL